MNIDSKRVLTLLQFPDGKFMKDFEYSQGIKSCNKVVDPLMATDLNYGWQELAQKCYPETKKVTCTISITWT